MTPAECLRRGAVTTAANPQLVVVRWAGELTVAALTVAGAVLPLWAVFGDGWWGAVTSLAAGDRPDLLAAGLLDFLLVIAAAPGRLVAGLAAALVPWTAAMLVYCWLQGGFYGLLAVADRQLSAAAGAAAGTAAGAAPRRTAIAARAAAAVFDARRFAALGKRLFGRYFWFVNLYATLIGLVAVAAALLVSAGAQGLERWGFAALGVGCLATLPLGLVAVALGLWYAVGRAELTREAEGVAASSRRAARLLVRRFGTVVLVAALALAASLAVSGLAAPLSLLLDRLLEPGGAAGRAGQALLTLAQWLAASAVATAEAAALVGLVRAEAAAGEVGA